MEKNVHKIIQISKLQPHYKNFINQISFTYEPQFLTKLYLFWNGDRLWMKKSMPWRQMRAGLVPLRLANIVSVVDGSTELYIDALFKGSCIWWSLGLTFVSLNIVLVHATTFFFSFECCSQPVTISSRAYCFKQTILDTSQLMHMLTGAAVLILICPLLVFVCFQGML